MYDSSLKYKWDNKNVLDTALQEGFEKGFEQGIEKGKLEFRRQIALEMKKKRPAYYANFKIHEASYRRNREALK